MYIIKMMQLNIKICIYLKYFIEYWNKDILLFKHKNLGVLPVRQDVTNFMYQRITMILILIPQNFMCGSRRVFSLKTFFL